MAVRRPLLLSLLALGASLVPMPPATAAAPPQPPAVGTCKNYDWPDIDKYSESSPAVGCDGPHTARVSAVGRVPRGTTYRSLAALEAVPRWVGRACLAGEEQLLGGSAWQRELTAYTTLWFVPTRAEWHAGARWFRCATVLRGSSSLLPMPTTAAPLLETAPSGAVHRCLGRRVAVWFSCSEPHTYWARTTFVIPRRAAGDRDAIMRAAARQCARDGAVRYTWPSASMIRAGLRLGVCYVPA